MAEPVFCNGDIYFNDELICHSYKQIKTVNTISEIKEKIIKKKPAFDGTIIRAYYNNEWKLATFSMDAFKSKWKCEKSFGELFLKHKKIQDFDIFLKRNYCYTFLLLDSEVEYYLNNVNDELFHINTYDLKNEKYVDERPLFSSMYPTLHESFGWVDKLDSSKGIKFKRPQRGMIYYTKDNVYIEDFKTFKFWKNIIKNHSRNDTFWYLKRNKPKLVGKFCDIYGNEYKSLDYYFEHYLKLCFNGFNESLDFPSIEFRDYYKAASEKNEIELYILSHHNSELNKICNDFKIMVELKPE